MHEGNPVLNIQIRGNGASTARLYILKAKSNSTLWTIEYIFTAFDFSQIKYCNVLLVPALS